MRLLADVGNFVRRHHPRPEAAGADEILARRELRGVALPVADAAVIVAGIAGDMRQRRLARNAAAGLADDDGHLALIVEALGLQRPDHRLAAADLAVGKAGEDHRMRRRGMAAFGEMRGVVDADAEDLVGIGNGRQQLDIRQRVVRRVRLAACFSSSSDPFASSAFSVGKSFSRRPASMTPASVTMP